MPIKGVSDIIWMPRLGKISMGYRDPAKNNAPTRTEYFVCPKEVQDVFGKQPKSLSIIIPGEDPNKFADQNYKAYSATRGLICKGDGEMARQLTDTDTGAISDHTSKKVEWKEVTCAGENCPLFQNKKCKMVMHFQFLMPDVPGLGIWQIDTSSRNSIININSFIAFMQNPKGPWKRISYIPLELTLEPKETINPETNKKQTIYVMNLRTKMTMAELAMATKDQIAKLFLPDPEDSEPVDDDGTYPADAIRPQSQSDKDFEKMGEERDRISAEKKVAADLVKKDAIPTTANVVSEKKEGGVTTAQEQRIDAAIKKADEVLSGTAKQEMPKQTGFVDIVWLKESLDTLQKAGLKAYSNKMLLSYIKVAFRIEAQTPSEAVAKLNEEQAKRFVTYIQEALRMV